MFKKTKLNRIAIAVAMSVGMSTAAMAQVTSSGVSGQIVGPNGNPALGTVVKVTHVPTGATKTVQVNSSGSFNFKGLRVGGPYTIEIDSDEFADQTVNEVYLTLGETANIERALESEADVERISVTASQVSSLAFGKVGPAAEFDLAALEQAPAINRDITDIVRQDPRLYVDEGGNNGIQCVGKNPRFNSLTVDGVRMNDSFGLNSNGYPTERMPFSYDAIEGVSVEIAPFDVIYGGFSACNISAVSKTGTNEFHGSAFFDYTGDSFRGSSLEGDDVEIGDFSEKRYGFSVGGAIVKDKLFFFAAYEKLKGTNLFDRGPIGSGAVNEVDITSAELDEIRQIAISEYDYDPGGIPTSIPNEDEKLLVKIDWNINDDHRFAFTYNYNDGNNFTESDGDSNEFEFENHLYERGAELTSYVGALYSDWNDNFSTEVRLTYLELDNRQNSLAGDGTIGGNDFGEIRVETDEVDVYLGSDDSRQANDLDYDLFGISFRGNYYFDNDHSLTFGYERDQLEVFNLFVQHTETEIRFEGIENFRNGFADAIYYNNAINGDLNSAAAEWGYVSNSLFVQDDFYLTDDLKLTAGLRYDWYTTSDRPAENPDFVADYQFSNSANLDNVGLLQPRVGFNYTYSDSTEIRGGVGLFSGGNPNVWMSNNYSNTNTTQVGARGRDHAYTNGTRSLFDEDIDWVNAESGVTAGPGYAIPSELAGDVSAGNGSNFEINYLDPGFDQPSEWKWALGMTHVTDSDYIFNADLLVTVTKDAAIVLHGDLEEVSTSEIFNADGYPIFDSVREASFVLTNTSETSTSYSLSGSVSKTYDNGIDMMLGYAYSDAEDVQPMNSSVAFSNYVNRAFFDPQEQVSSTSDYNIKHRFTASLNYATEFLDGYETSFSLFGMLNSGQPYSIVRNGFSIGSYGFEDEDAGIDYSGVWVEASSINNVLLEPGSRNAEEGSWWGKLDLRVSQELPSFSEGHKASAFFVIDNLTNLINDDWGVLNEPNFPATVLEGDEAESRNGDASLYQIRVGLTYKF